MYRSMVLAAAALGSMQMATADAQSVYVAPGGVYIASGPVYVTPGSNGVSPYGAPYGGPAYRAPGSVYGLPSVYRRSTRYAAPPATYDEREPAYIAGDYSDEIAPRPPLDVPYTQNHRCVVPLGYGRWSYCD
jgi:hypothetical protein